MSFSDWIQAIVSILSGLAVVIPVVIALVRAIKQAAQEKNWSKIVDLALGYMKIAEANFESGADRKDWVLSMVRESAQSTNYNYDEEAEAKLSALIDSICTAAKAINKK